jgi:hypothetical protein
LFSYFSAFLKTSDNPINIINTPNIFFIRDVSMRSQKRRAVGGQLRRRRRIRQALSYGLFFICEYKAVSVVGRKDIRIDGPGLSVSDPGEGCHIDN